MNIRELEIIKSALEGDIVYQKKSEHVDHPAFKDWLYDTEKLLRKITNELYIKKSKQQLYEKLRR